MSRRERPVAVTRRRLTPATSFLLGALRVYVVLSIALVIVTFVRALHR